MGPFCNDPYYPYSNVSHNATEFKKTHFPLDKCKTTTDLFIIYKMKKEVSQIFFEVNKCIKNKTIKGFFQLTVHIIYGIRAIRNNSTWAIISCGVVVIISVFFLMMITHFTCFRNREVPSEESLEEITTLNRSYIKYNTVERDNSKPRMSQYSMDTDHEFSFYDPIDNNPPASEVATMRMLSS